MNKTLREAGKRCAAGIDLQDGRSDAGAMQRWLTVPRQYRDNAEYATAVHGYRGGGGLAWKLAQVLFVVVIFGSTGVGAFLYLGR